MELEERQFEVYVPMIYQSKMVQSKFKAGKKRLKLVRQPLPNLVFVHADRAEAETIVKGASRIPYLRYYYNHLESREPGSERPVTVSNREMQQFMRIADVDDEDVKILNEGDCRYKDNQLVRITQGSFAGVTGRLVRAKGEQRVVVSLNGMFLIATAYVPTAYLEPVGR